MKRKIFMGIGIIVFVAIMGINLKVNTTKGSVDFTLENIEAAGSGNYEYVEPGSPGSGVVCVCYMSGDKSCCD
jgi:hypothetical protein